jgi:hypothetical protein
LAYLFEWHRKMQDPLSACSSSISTMFVHR